MEAEIVDMECKDLIERVTAYLEGAVSEDERARIEAHLSECEWCERYLEQTRQVAAALGHLDDGSTLADVEAWERALSAFRGERRAG